MVPLLKYPFLGKDPRFVENEFWAVIRGVLNGGDALSPEMLRKISWKKKEEIGQNVTNNYKFFFGGGEGSLKEFFPKLPLNFKK